MISPKIQDLLNAQLNREYSSSYAYLAMAAYVESESLVGFAHWLRVQHREELEHALKFYDYINAQNGRVTLAAIDQPRAEYKSVFEVFQKVLEHEKYITRSVNEIYGAAEAEKDYATKTFLSWFVSEQVEEESEAQLMVDKLAMIGDSKGSLLYLDKEAKKRE
ncbi:MAG: ferritin [Planctomycetia bacterium]|nr:ferritin [Planctomycetia bacterium]